MSLSPQVTSSLPFPINHLSCKLTDPHHQHIPCSITSTQPEVCIVKYTPTVHGPHQLRIIVKETEIEGSPFTVYVLLSPEMRGVVQHTHTGINRPRGVAMSRSGEVVVSEYWNHCISRLDHLGLKDPAQDSSSILVMWTSHPTTTFLLPMKSMAEF